MHKHVKEYAFRVLDPLIGTAIVAPLGLWFRDDLSAWFQKEKTLPESQWLVLLLLLLLFLSTLYVVKELKGRFFHPYRKNNLLWKIGVREPFCPICKSQNEKLNHMEQTRFSGKLGYRCHACDHQHIQEDGGMYHAERFRKA